MQNKEGGGIPICSLVFCSWIYSARITRYAKKGEEDTHLFFSFSFVDTQEHYTNTAVSHHPGELD